MLTSPRARDMLRTVRTVIVDEIHTLCGNKRGVHLALSLERLGRLTDAPFQRIGLSATQRPLDEVARFLVGQDWQEDDEGGEQLASRPVTIVDAGAHKALDLQVVTVVPDLRQLPGGSIWPSLIPEVLDEMRQHRTTLIFANSRRGAERAADRLNEQYALEEAEEVAPGSPEALLVEGVPRGEGMFGTGRAEGPFRAHHGSVSREVRLELEQQLKAGELPALIGTSSLELGIDIGAVDLVVQLQSPRRHRPRPAARGPLRPPGGADQRGPHLCHLPRGPAGRRRGGPRHAGRRCRADLHAAATAWTCWRSRSWPWSAWRTGVDALYRAGVPGLWLPRA